MAQIIVRLGYVKLQRKESVEGILWYKRVLPVGLAHASTLAFGNTVYLFLKVGFIQMLKSFTPVIVMLTGYLANIEVVTLPVIYAVLIISIGTAATCSFNPEFSFIGMLIMFLAELAEGIRLIFTQYFLQQLKFGIIEGQYFLSPASAFWLFFASALYESPTMYANGAFYIIANNWLSFFFASFMGIGVNYLSYLVIQYTSSLTMKILSAVRNILLVFVGILFYNEVVSVNQGIGYFIALVGFALYNIAKSGYFETKVINTKIKTSDLNDPKSLKSVINNSNVNDSDVEALLQKE
jgi:drug/metabolite transporter (DMT)-like permease